MKKIVLAVPKRIAKVVERVFAVNMAYVFVISVTTKLVKMIWTFVIGISTNLILQCFIAVLK